VSKSRARPRKPQPKPAQKTQQIQSKKKDIWRRPAVWLGATGTAVLIGVLVNVLSTQAQRVAPSADPTASSSPQLVVDQVSLGFEPVKGGNVSLFKIDIKLLNTGTQIVAINSADLTIQDFVTLPLCASQGGFASTGEYRSNLPVNPSTGQVVSVPISQLVEANGADRFDLLLAAPLSSTTNARFNIYLYRVHLRLTYNVHEAPLDLGEIAVDFPDVPSDGEYYWSKYWATHLSEFNYMAFQHAATVKSCDIKNSLALHSFLLKPAMRTTSLTALLSTLAYK
jgi:hypothetical protein